MGELTRRKMLGRSVAALAGGALFLKAGDRVRAEEKESPAPEGEGPGRPESDGGAKGGKSWDSHLPPVKSFPPGEPGRDYTPVVTPNARKAPFKVVGGAKVFHIIAEEVLHEIAPWLKLRCWGYNGGVHGPTLEAVEGDHVRIYVTNRLKAPTTIHWHGFIIPSGMDGVGGMSQRSIRPGETFKYEFTLRQHGTLMYHSHHDEMTQIAMGMTGMFVIHPRQPTGPKVDRDFAILLHEWAIKPGASRPDPNEMSDFNVLTMNAKAFPGTEALVCKLGERVRVRLANLSPMSHHSIHIHGHFFWVTATDGDVIPESARWPETTVIVPVGSTRNIEFVADNPGDWAFHCHMIHHVMNQMGHGIPNMIGVDPKGFDPRVRKLLPSYMTMGEAGMAEMGTMGMPMPENSIPMMGAPGAHDYITMGGMFTIVKIRRDITSYEDPGWYENPPGTQADVASEEELRRDGVEVGPAPPSPKGPVTYTCPMHPEVETKEPGRCPKCGMNLVPKE